MMEMFRFKASKTSPLSKLSGGQKQRVAFPARSSGGQARCSSMHLSPLAKNAQNGDAETSETDTQKISDSLVLVAHDVAEAYTLAGGIIVYTNGSVVRRTGGFFKFRERWKRALHSSSAKTRPCLNQVRKTIFSCE